MIYKDLSKPGKFIEKETISPEFHPVSKINTPSEQLADADRRASEEEEKRRVTAKRKATEQWLKKAFFKLALAGAVTALLASGVEKLGEDEYIDHNGEIRTISGSLEPGR